MTAAGMWATQWIQRLSVRTSGKHERDLSLQHVMSAADMQRIRDAKLADSNVRTSGKHERDLLALKLFMPAPGI